jgi:ribosomal protein L9
MRDAADKRKELEQQHAEALSQLRDKQSELQRLTKFSTNTSSEKKSKNYETIEALQVVSMITQKLVIAFPGVAK